MRKIRQRETLEIDIGVADLFCVVGLFIRERVIVFVRKLHVMVIGVNGVVIYRVEIVVRDELENNVLETNVGCLLLT